MGGAPSDCRKSRWSSNFEGKQDGRAVETEWSFQPGAGATIMPCNGASHPYLESSIMSVLNSSVQELELIVVNDGSTDGTAAMLDDFAHRDVRIKVLTA